MSAAAVGGGGGGGGSAMVLPAESVTARCLGDTYRLRLYQELKQTLVEGTTPLLLPPLIRLVLEYVLYPLLTIKGMSE